MFRSDSFYADGPIQACCLKHEPSALNVYVRIVALVSRGPALASMTHFERDAFNASVDPFRSDRRSDTRFCTSPSA